MYAFFAVLNCNIGTALAKLECNHTNASFDEGFVHTSPLLPSSPCVREQDHFQALTEALSRSFENIRKEFLALSSDMITDVGRRRYEWGDQLQSIVSMHEQRTGWMFAWNPYDNATNHEWMNFGLMFEDNPVGKNAALCPHTLKALCELPIRIHIAGFSLMSSHSVIHKHTDDNPQNVRVMHMGIDVPSGENSILSVQTGAHVQTIVEENGKAFVFDAHKPHYAVNFSDKPRTVLFVEFEYS